MAEVDQRTFGERVSDLISQYAGSWWFIFGGILLIAVWCGLNTLALFDVIAWDKFPFILLNLFLSMVAAFQAPFILMSQRRAEVKQDLAYRSLFREIKELVESDLSLEQEIMERSKNVEAQIEELKGLIRELKNK